MGDYKHQSSADRFLRQIRQVGNDPFFMIKQTYSRFNGNVPKICRKPILSDYGLSDNVELELQEIEKRNRRKESIEYLCIFVFGLLVVTFLLFYFVRLSIWSCLGSGLCIWVPVFLFVGAIFGKKKDYRASETQTRYNNFLSDSAAFEYWQKLNSLEYWTNLSGHEFEDACASVFRKMGYEATVSKAGGDGGIDIVLVRGEERIAVQCKAHKNPVSPSVARDLFGTMLHFGYEKGMLISTNGFTSGVYDFVKNKPITLYTLNDIVRFASE